MKTFFKITILLYVITICSCSSDDGNNEEISIFDTISQPDIEALESTMINPISNATNEAGDILWENDKILLYKTNRGRLGKLKVLNIDVNDNYKLAIQVVTYNADGSIYNSNDFFEVPGTWTVDLDNIELTSLREVELTDFLWDRSGIFFTRFRPFSGSSFLEYEHE